MRTSTCKHPRVRPLAPGLKHGTCEECGIAVLRTDAGWQAEPRATWAFVDFPEEKRRERLRNTSSLKRAGLPLFEPA